MPFVKGKSGNASGRPKSAIDFQAAARAHSKEVLARMMEIVRSDDLGAAARAGTIVLAYAHGKPVQPLTHDVPQDSTLATILRNLPRTTGIPTDKMPV